MSYKRIEELVILSKQGDKVAMEELLNTYKKLIRRYTDTYFIKGYQDDDISQIAKMTVIQAVQKYDISKGSNFTGFLDIFLRNTFTTMINKKENTTCTHSLNVIVYADSEDIKEYQDILIDDMDIEEDLVEKEQRSALRVALDKLSKEHKEILLAAYSGHGGLKEYGRKNGISYSSCRRRRDRAMEILKKKMHL